MPIISGYASTNGNKYYWYWFVKGHDSTVMIGMGMKKRMICFFSLSRSFSFSFWFLFVFVNLISYLHLAQFPNHANFERLLPRFCYYCSLETPYSTYTCGIDHITKKVQIQVRRFKWFPEIFLTCDRRQDIRMEKKQLMNAHNAERVRENEM